MSIYDGEYIGNGTIECTPSRYCKEGAEEAVKALNNGDEDWRYVAEQVGEHYQIRVFDEDDVFIGWM
jgi:hypothetical protein